MQKEKHSRVNIKSMKYRGFGGGGGGNQYDLFDRIL